MAAELVETEGEVRARASDRIAERWRATATRGRVLRGTGLAMGEGMVSRKNANMMKNRINGVLQVLKAAEISLTGEDGCLGTDAAEAMMGLGGAVVGLELGMAQVPRACINREPGETMQDKHCTHQQEQVKEGNEVNQIVLEPSKEHNQMHGKLSLDM